MLEETAELRKWERVEIERSAAEAGQQDLSSLRVHEAQVNRYLNPAAETIHPYEFAYHLLGDVRGRKVLDFGCGNGENTLILANRGAAVLAMDISTASIKVAEKRLAVNEAENKAAFFAGSAHDLPLADNSVDVVFGMAILHHLDLKFASREVFRVLKEGGKAIFLEPVRNSKLIWFVRNLIPYQQPDISPFERPLTDSELSEFAGQFSSYSSRAFCLPYMNLIELFVSNDRILNPLRQFDQRVLRNLPFTRYYATIRVVEMKK